MNSIKPLLDDIINGYRASVNEIIQLLKSTGDEEELIYSTALNLTKELHGNLIYLRGLIEFSNWCTNSCLYCGIRAGATGFKRYRMTQDEIVETAQYIKASNCGTVVLQCGIDPFFTTNVLADIITAIKATTGLAVTLSIGTKSYDDLARLKNAGANRFLLRFESCQQSIFKRIHPDESFEERVECIRNLQKLDYQTGSGFMIGLPGADLKITARDILFTKELELDMIGCGPFIPSPQTPLSDESILDDYSIYYKTMALVRILNPQAHIPAATAFDSLKEDGRDEVIKCGANVFMPNFTPERFKENYKLYPGKSQVDTSTDIYDAVKTRIEDLGRSVSSGVGHALRMS
ncbi:MAG: [FeFe] hydrogenase H-cluster radical SAM maturase HydE [Kiritimatiellae bacterium]|jgi:biotin synthase|nr:[FeFe] hydrogenase H-cluster radical SAM maturase HydE [Kiritimatiellia bacterium]